MNLRQRWKIGITVTCILFILGIFARAFSGHVGHEIAQDVEIGKTQVEVQNIQEDVKDIKGDIDQIEKTTEDIDEKLDLLLISQGMIP